MVKTKPMYYRQQQEKLLFIRSGSKWIKLIRTDITILEGLRNYTTIYTKGNIAGVTTPVSLKTMISKFPNSKFLRVHRSFITSLDHIDSISKNEIFMDDRVIPVVKAYQTAFTQIINDLLGYAFNKHTITCAERN